MVTRLSLLAHIKQRIVFGLHYSAACCFTDAECLQTAQSLLSHFGELCFAHHQVHQRFLPSMKTIH